MSDTATYCAGHWLALKGDQCWALVQLGPGDPRVTGVQAALADPHPVDAGDDKDLENSIVEIQQALNGIDDLRAQIQE
ncbi:hypothetical protein, partial [Nocardioides sp. NPDC000441]|uniref:hypothetical protein n=1 Tax=Nocardioides sp. NPDC000441 TaxID=3154256 RepID=UPI0033198851